MLSSLWKRLTVGGDVDEVQEVEEPSLVAAEEDDDDDTDIRIPQVRTAITTGSSRNAAPPNEEEEPDKSEKVEAVGYITALDLSMAKGVIDRTYQFDIDKFCSGHDRFERGSKVEFEAERSRHNPQWYVTQMKLFVSDVEKTKRELQRIRKLVVQVKSVSHNFIEVEIGKDKSSSNNLLKLPNQNQLKIIKWIQGDWIQLEFENISDDDTLDSRSETRSKLLSALPLQKKTVVGKVTTRHQHFLIDDCISFTQDVCNTMLSVGAVVRCDAIQSKQFIGPKDYVSWRATKVEKSNFLHYTSPEVMSDPDGSWQMDDVGREAVERHKELLVDKCGISICPQNYVAFPIMIIGTSAAKTIKITNSSQMKFHLRKIHLKGDPTVCQFDVRSKQLDRDGGFTFLPEDEVDFQVTCRPMIIGRTTELCVFDFGNFLIARKLIVTGKDPDEDAIAVDKSTYVRPHFKKQIGDVDISKIVTDRDRRRIRGSQTIRAPFFSQKRLPLSKVPPHMWTILKQRDETELKRAYPNALNPLNYENYKQKFSVSLWFEEMENDLRRRQYDLKNVILVPVKSGIQSMFKFIAPGVQEFQPPVNVQDAIDVFDAEANTNAKYQGTITKISDTGEVTCIFGEAFSNQYRGFPLTIQFCLGRTNYKRCHFAVQTAIDYLGEDFLFPNKVTACAPRILVYEDENDSPNVENIGTEENALPSDISHGKDNDDTTSIFRKSQQQAIFSSNPGSSTSRSSSEVVGRRVQSLKSRFVSDTASAPSCSTAKLVWFNTALNEEQKDAVRRILRGQARPLPYIIYGPPGTGKTVTLVEAIMQVNKLDQNSRILVCAPSNAAADIIAEYLANSNRYHPGDFVRLNGFLRSEQSMLDTIEPYCTNGDDLVNVAMHRLIISTCITAGQFFTLDLSVGHFTHIFIDEAGYCTEPEAMIPAVLLALSKGGQLILAGDPNQLGPVLMSDVSQNCGLNKSLLERLMTRQLYSRDIDRYPQEKYNPLVLTKLVKNYRAHPTLLKLPSRLFYDDDLESKASFEEAYAPTQNEAMSTVLVSQGVPLVFHGVQGHCTREKDSPSWCNTAEVVQIVSYVSALRQCGLKHDDIGIITPYRKQVEKIRLALNMAFIGDEIPKAASVEEFQGGERKVIIISTVRSAHEDKIDNCLERLGFLYQPKRFNVAITRAKALMIVVGNPHVLERNPYWLQLLRYAIELNAYKGCNLPIRLDQELKKILDSNKPTHDENDDEAEPKFEGAVHNFEGCFEDPDDTVF